MREVCGVSGGSGLGQRGDAATNKLSVKSSDKNNNNLGNMSKNCKNMSSKNGSSPDIKMSSTPGYLELSPEKMDALICHEPIEEFYDVEDQPFARGKYAAVRRCRHKESGQQFAAKFLKKHRRSADLRPEILHEVAILDACAGSSRIVRLHQVFESQHEMVLLLELAPGGELQMLLDNDEVPEEVEVKKLMRQILDGLIFLHSINVAHLDLKPQNLVLTGAFPQCEVKLCDLGISRYISKGADIRDILGTPDYVAPEVLNYESISLATDMWSVGVLLYVLLTGCSPFGGDTKQETFCNISQCNLDFPEDLFEDISGDAIDLMKKLMVKDPSQRLDAQQCLQHQWFKNEPLVKPSSSLKLSLAKVQEMNASPIPARKLESCQAIAQASPKLKHKAPVETTISDKPGDFVASLTPRASPKLKHKAPVETPLGDKASDLLTVLTLKALPKFKRKAPPETPLTEKPHPFQVPEIRVTKQADQPNNTSKEDKPTIQTEVKTCTLGIKSSRRDNFKKNLSELAQRHSSESDESGTIENVKTTKPTTVFIPLEPQKHTVSSTNNEPEPGKMRKAKSMHLLPTDDKFESTNTNVVVHLNVVNFNVSDVRRRAPVSNRDSLYSFRKCIVIDDEDVSPPMSIAGSVSSSVYSDQSISDSGSEVSELSSDRSSIISLDESLDYGTKAAGGHYRASSCAGHNIWNKRPVSTVDTFATAFMRFSGGGVDADREGRTKPSRRPARGAHTVVLNRVPALAAVDRPTCRVEFRKERFGNLVVIREVKAGRYLQVKEVKCESLQARIRMLEMQGIQKS